MTFTEALGYTVKKRIYDFDAYRYVNFKNTDIALFKQEEDGQRFIGKLKVYNRTKYAFWYENSDYDEIFAGFISKEVVNDCINITAVNYDPYDSTFEVFADYSSIENHIDFLKEFFEEYTI